MTQTKTQTQTDTDAHIQADTNTTLLRLLGARSEPSEEATVQSNLIGNAGSHPTSVVKQLLACPLLRRQGPPGNRTHCTVSNCRSPNFCAAKHVFSFFGSRHCARFSSRKYPKTDVLRSQSPLHFEHVANSLVKIIV